MAHNQERNRGVIRVILEQDAGFTAWLSDQFGSIRKRFDALDRRLDQLEKNIMDKLDQALQDIADEKTAIGSVTELINNLRQQVADALSGVTLPPAIQAKVDQVFAGLEDNKALLAKALTTQPSGAPVTPPPPSDGGSTPPAANPAAGL
jgi:ABC-type transporter Mla subunit MlaD